MTRYVIFYFIKHLLSPMSAIHTTPLILTLKQSRRPCNLHLPPVYRLLRKCIAMIPPMFCSLLWRIIEVKIRIVFPTTSPRITYLPEQIFAQRAKSPRIFDPRDRIYNIPTLHIGRKSSRTLSFLFVCTSSRRTRIIPIISTSTSTSTLLHIFCHFKRNVT